MWCVYFLQLRNGDILKPLHFSDLCIYRDRGGEVLFDTATLYGHKDAVETLLLAPTGSGTIREREASATKALGYVVNREAVFGLILRGDGMLVLIRLHVSVG